MQDFPQHFLRFFGHLFEQLLLQHTMTQHIDGQTITVATHNDLNTKGLPTDFSFFLFSFFSFFFFPDSIYSFQNLRAFEDSATSWF